MSITSMPMSSKLELQNLMTQLIAAGENRDEFDLWLKIYDDLPEEKQRQLIAMMRKELEDLEKIKK